MGAMRGTKDSLIALPSDETFTPYQFIAILPRGEIAQEPVRQRHDPAWLPGIGLP